MELKATEEIIKSFSKLQYWNKCNIGLFYKFKILQTKMVCFEKGRANTSEMRSLSDTKRPSDD